MKPAACPSREELSAFILGQLADDRLDRVAEHSSQCGKCQKMLHGLDAASDALLDRVRHGRAPAKPVAELAPLLKKAEALSVAAHGVTVSTGDTLGGPPQLTQDIRAVLQPAQGPGEMGRLGRYRVLKLLGHGGMGMVFQAEDPSLQRTVALKVMLPGVSANPAAKERFLREARATAAIEHDHIVTIYQVDEDRGVPYLAMQFLKGMSLEDYLKKARETKKPLTLGQILKLGREIGKGLAAAHERALIHRDIKPANVWLDATAGGRAKILDFGLARPAATDSNITQSGMIVGTPAYMAPEQATGQKIDGRADLFSLGVVLYRLCSGRLPWKGETAMATLMAVATEETTPLRQLKPELPAGLTDLVMKLLAKKPEDRPKSAKAVVEAITAIEKSLATDKVKVAAPVQPAGAPWQEFDERSETAPLVKAPVRKRSRRWPLVAGALLLLGGAVVLWQVIIRIENKDGSKTEIKVPAGATVTVDKDGKSVAQVGGVGQGGQPVAAKPSEVDLLKLIDPAKHSVIGKWAFDGDVLVAPMVKLVAAIQVPYTPPEEYEVEVVATRIETGGGSGLVVGLLAGGRQFHAVVDDYNGTASGLANIDNKTIADNETYYRGKLLTTGKPSVVIGRVQRGVISVSIDGQTLINWKGEFSRLSRHPLWNVPRRDQLYLGTTNATFRISKLVLRPLTQDDAWVAAVQKRPAEKQVEAVAAKLKELNPGFDGKVEHKIENGAVTKLQFATDEVTDLRPIRALLGLRDLTCKGTSINNTGKLKDLTPLQGMKLEFLSVDQNGQLQDLTPLAGMPLVKLFIWGTSVRDLAPLKGMALVHLGAGYSGYTDLEPLQGMPLQTLWICGNRVFDLSPLRGMPLEHLWCQDTAVQDIAPLRGLPLTELALQNNLRPERDLPHLAAIWTLGSINGKGPIEFWNEHDAKHAAFLQWIASTRNVLPPDRQVELVVAKLKERNPGFDGTVTHKVEKGVVTELKFFTDNVPDIAPVRALPRLTKLECNGSGWAKGKLRDLGPLQGMKLKNLWTDFNLEVKTLTPLAGMPLESLNCCGNSLKDLRPLAGMPLKYLQFNANAVADLTPLKGLPLTHLIFQENQVRDLSPLRGMPLRSLDFVKTPVQDLEPLKSLPLQSLRGDIKPERDTEILRSIKTLEKINGQPAADFLKTAGK